MGLAARTVVLLVETYQVVVRPLLPPSCRFAPTCSEYAREAISSHGLVRGTALAARRLSRCHPFNPGGYDPPPRPRVIDSRTS